MKLSMLWFTDKDHFQKKLTSLRKKMEQVGQIGIAKPLIVRIIDWI